MAASIRCPESARVFTAETILLRIALDGHDEVRGRNVLEDHALEAVEIVEPVPVQLSGPRL